MATVKMEVARALNELKLLKKRLEKAAQGTVFFGVSVGGKPVPGYKDNEEFKQKAQSAFDSFRALLDRYNAIKAAINRSNATTYITVAGKEMTVAEAIERLRNLELEEDFLAKLKADYNTAVRAVEVKNLEAQNKLENYLNTIYGKDTKLTPEQQQAVAEPFLAQFSAELVYPEKLKDLIDQMEAEINAFKAEVHFALNRSNALTMIEVPA